MSDDTDPELAAAAEAAVATAQAFVAAFSAQDYEALVATLQDGHWGIQFRSSYLGLA